MKKIIEIGKSISGPMMFWIATMAANFLNWLFNIQAGRTLLKEEFAVLSVFLALQYILTVPANALMTTVSRFTAFYSERGEETKHFYFFRQYWWLSWALGLLAFILFIVFQNLISGFFGIDSSFLIIIFSSLLIPLFLLSFEKGALSGQLAFTWLGILAVTEALTKFGFFYFSKNLPFQPLTLALMSLPISIFVAWFISLLIARSYHPLQTKSSAKSYGEQNETYKFLSNSFFAGLGVVLIYSMDVLLVKHFFSAGEAGIYSTLSLLGKVVYFGAGSLIGLLIPLVTRAYAKNLSGRKQFLTLFSVVSIVGGLIVLSFQLIPEVVVGFLLKERGAETIPYLAKYSMSMFFLVLAMCFSTFNLAKKNYLPSRLIILAALVEAIFITLNHSSLEQVVSVVFATLFGLLITLISLEIFKFAPIVLKNNNTITSGKLRILIFNWRDIKHIHAGGAELYIHEIAKRLVKKDYEITIFTANDQKSKSEQIIDGVSIIRRGGFITVYIWAALYYLLRFRGKFDLIIDCENGIPFFTPLYSRKPVVLIVHHVHQDVFFSSLVPPFSWIANFLESFVMPIVYKKAKVVTVSNSTSEELATKIGLSTDLVVPTGVDTEFYHARKKSLAPLICYVGRIKKYKSIEVLLEAFSKLAQNVKNAELVIAGEGDYRQKLEKDALDLNLKDRIKFLGKISDNEKIRLLGSSWVMVQPSFQEGWGITCLEANACGTLVLASRVNGLKEAVREGKSGYLFEYGNSNELYQKLKNIVTNRRERITLGKSARVWSYSFNWDNQAEKFDLLIKKSIDQPKLNFAWSFLFRLRRLV